MVVLPDGKGPCKVTFIANLFANGDMTFVLFSVEELNQFLSDSNLPQMSQGWTNRKRPPVDALPQTCLSVGITRGDYSGCHNYNMGG